MAGEGFDKEAMTEFWKRDQILDQERTMSKEKKRQTDFKYLEPQSKHNEPPVEKVSPDDDEWAGKNYTRPGSDT